MHLRTETHRYGRNQVYIDRFKDPRDLIETTKGRPLPHPSTYRTRTHDYFCQNIDLEGDEWRGGYNDSNECTHVFEFGTRDRKTIEEADRFRAVSTTTNNRKLATRKLMMYGGAVNMGRYMTGSPQCMVAVKRENVPSRIIEMVIDSAVSCFVDADDIRIVGMACLGAIARLESMGYKVKVNVLSTVKQDNGNIIGLDLLVKDSSEILSPTRVLFPIQDPAFLRVVTMAWSVHHPKWDDSSGMGQPLNYSVKDLDNFYKKTYGYDRVFNMQRLTDLVRGETDFMKALHVRDYLVSQLTG